MCHCAESPGNIQEDAVFLLHLFPITHSDTIQLPKALISLTN